MMETTQAEIISDQGGWITATLDGYWLQGKVYDQPSQFGIEGGRVSKLAIAEGPKWTGLRHAIYHYDRGLDVDRTPAGLVRRAVAMLEEYRAAHPPG